MALNDITIVKGQGGLGRPLPGQDYISGLMFYTNTLPSGFGTSTRIKQIYSLAQAEALGILGDYSDETRAIAKLVLTNNGTGGAAGDTIEVKIQEPVNLVSLGVYTLVAATAGTANLIPAATAIVAMINAGTYSHGYSATNSASATILITFKKGLGKFPNTGTPLSTVLSNSVTNYFSTVLTQPTGAGSTVLGVASLLAQWHYHIAEYFRIQPGGNLFTGFFALSGNAFDYAEISTMQNFALGKIRQIGIYLANTGSHTSAANIATAADAIQVQCAANETLHFPLSAIFATDISTISDLTTLVDLSAKTDAKVSTTIGQDGVNQGASGLGWNIYKAQGYSITNLGAVLGAISLSKVNEDISWVQKFNLSDGKELAYPAFGNGSTVNIITDNNLLVQLNNYRYIFLRYFAGTTGSFVNDNHCLVTQTSDYAFINDNRTFDKAQRLLYAGVLPFLGGSITLNSDGTMADTTLSYVKSLANNSIDPMVRNQEISTYKVTIDPTQNVLGTSKLVLAVQVLPNGVARNIEIDLGYTKKIT